MACTIFLIVALFVAVCSPVYSQVALAPRRGILSPSVAYGSTAPAYAYSSPFAYSAAVPADAAVHAIPAAAAIQAIPAGIQAYPGAYRNAIRPSVYAARTPIISQAAADPQYDPNPQYAYSYSVNDPETGDTKSQEETRNGDSVQGSYSLIESDGSRRVVEYTADPVSGFNAVVHREAGAAPPPPAPIKTAAGPILAARYAAPQPVPIQPAPAVAYRAGPGLAYRSGSIIAPQVAYQPAPALRYSVPASPALAYSSVIPSGQAGAVHTSFSTPFSNYAY